jgi:hypothetical protein
VRHQVVLTVRPNADFAYGEPLAELDQSCFRKEITGRRLSEEIDGQVGGDREGHPADRRKDRHVHGHIRKSHDDGPETVPPGRSDFGWKCRRKRQPPCQTRSRV